MKMSCGDAPYFTAFVVLIGAMAIGSNVMLLPEIERTIEAVSALRLSKATPAATFTRAPGCWVSVVNVMMFGETLVFTDCTIPTTVPSVNVTRSLGVSGVVALTCPVGDVVEKPVPAVEPQYC